MKNIGHRVLLAARVVSGCAFMVLALASCGSRGSSVAHTQVMQPDQPVIVPVDMRTALPEIPSGADDTFSMRRVISAASYTQLGYDAETLGTGASIVGTAVHFAPAANSVAFATFGFDAAPGDTLTEVTYQASALAAGGKIYLAVADYTHNAWSFFPAQTGLSGSFNPGSHDFISPAGHVFVAAFAWDGKGFDLETIGVGLPSRHGVIGKVVDHAGTGIPGAQISTPLGGQRTFTDPTGNFTLNGLPDGTWPLLVTKTGYTFFSQPTVVNISGSNVTIPDYVGEQDGSHFYEADTAEPNNRYPDAKQIPYGQDYSASLSSIDDPIDYYRITLPAAGYYWFEMDSSGPQIFYPYMDLFDESVYRRLNPYSPEFAYGTTWIGQFYATGPRDIVVRVSCDGGGGAYTLKTFSSAGPGHNLSFALDNGASQPYVVKTKIHNAARNTDSFYFVEDSSPQYLNALPPGMYTVAPDDSTYTFGPPSLDADLTASDPSLLFSFSNPAVVDSHEPNDTSAQAFNVASLPFTENDLNMLTASDGNDIFKISPPAGKLIRVRVDCHDSAAAGTEDTPFGLSVYNSALTNQQYFMAYTDTGFETRTMTATDGNPYYVEVYGDMDSRTRAYSIHIEVFDGHFVDYTIDREITGAVLGRIRVHSDSFDWGQTLEISNLNYFTSAIPVMDGERLFAECLRYGLSCDRETKITTVSGADVTEHFIATQDSGGELDGIDSGEANDGFLINNIALPFSIDASISQYDDRMDVYGFMGDAALSTKFVIDAPQQESAGSIQLIVYNASHVQIAQYPLDQQGHATWVVPPLGNLQSFVAVYAFGGNSPYTLSISNVTAYPVNFHFIDSATLTGESAVGISETITGDTVHTNASGDAPVQYVEPGNHAWLVYKANRAMQNNMGSDFIIRNVTGPTLVADTWTNDPRDNGEPNDSTATATPLTLGNGMTATVSNYNLDNFDYYKFDATAGDHIQVHVSTQRTDGYLYAYLIDPSMTYVQSLSISPQITTATLDADIRQTGTYYLLCQGASFCSDYGFFIEKLN